MQHAAVGFVASAPSCRVWTTQVDVAAAAVIVFVFLSLQALRAFTCANDGGGRVSRKGKHTAAGRGDGWVRGSRSSRSISSSHQRCEHINRLLQVVERPAWDDVCKGGPRPPQCCAGGTTHDGRRRAKFTARV